MFETVEKIVHHLILFEIIWEDVKNIFIISYRMRENYINRYININRSKISKCNLNLCSLNYSNKIPMTFHIV